MISKGTVSETFLDSVGRRVIKFLGFGKNSDKAIQANNFGLDSNPIKDMTAIVSETSSNGKTVIVGYINRNQVAGIGETRLFSLNANGQLQTYLWLKNDGDTWIGGNTKHLARFEELKTGFDQLKTDLNDLVTKFNAHQHPTAGSGPPSPPTLSATSSTASIDNSKTLKVKTA